jgi:hypothetical protein
MTNSLPRLVSPRAAETLEAVRSVTGSFDVDAWHVMDERDNQLIADEILHGAGSELFVYNFEIKGTQVSGISVIGARHLANHYRGLKHRLVASMQKTGELFQFTSYPSADAPMNVACSVVNELSSEPDFYAAVVEVTDIKTGNSIQVERREARLEQRRDGSQYERPNFATIAQSKAYRNAVLALIPQDVQIRWKAEMLKLRKGETITASVLEQKRSGVLRFAAQKALALDRRRIEQLTLDQIAGLGDAARDGNLPAFAQAAQALGLTTDQPEQQTIEPTPQAQAPRRRGRPPRQRQDDRDDGFDPGSDGPTDEPDHLTPVEPLPEAESLDIGPQTMTRPAPRRRGVSFEE